MKRTSVFLSLLLTTSGAAQAQSVDPKIITHDDLLVRISDKAPGFAGMFLDAKGVFTIRMTNADWLKRGARPAESLAKVVGAITSVMGPDVIENAQRSRPEASTREIALVGADFDFRKLYGWSRELTDLLSKDGVYGLDVNETLNRITIDIDPAIAADVAAFVSKRGIPKEAVILLPGEPFNPDATLRDKFRPAPGGVQIEADVGLTAYRTCTLGFNVLRAGRRGFVTNAHCTRNSGVSNNTAIHQPDDPILSEANKIGNEDADPPFFTGQPCPTNRRCRFSDAAYVDYDRSVSGAELIARPVDTLGSLQIDSANPRFRIVGETLQLVEGMIVNKVGRTTGWTFGGLTRVCSQVPAAGTNHTLLCQATVSRLVGDKPLMSSGDSGSPAFILLAGRNEVSLAGVAWGSTSRSFVFSALDMVKQELGPMRTFSPPPPPAPPSPPSTRAECLEGCDAARDACIADGGLASQCVPVWNACRAACAAQ